MALARKFYKLFSLNGIFKYETVDEKVIYTTDVNGFEPDFLNEYHGLIDEHTILFITANREDVGRYVNVFSRDSEGVITDSYLEQIKEGDTFVWARGDLYCHAGQGVIDISYDRNTGIITVTYKNGDTLDIPVGGAGLAAIYPLIIDNNSIKIEGFYYDENNNVIENIEGGSNAASVNAHNGHVEGEGNTITVNHQHVQGKYAVIDNDSIFIIGGGSDSSNRVNVFTVDFNGTAYAQTDVTAGGTKANPTYKLSDIHEVIDNDWAIIGV